MFPPIFKMVVNIEEFEKNLKLNIDPFEIPGAMQALYDSAKVGRNTKAETPTLFSCSVCGWECWDTVPCDTETFNYCPNCGAKMKGE